jgi:hypothetical protein
MRHWEELYISDNENLKYRVAQNSINLKYSNLLTGLFRFKPASQSVEQYRRVVSCALKMEDIISSNFCKFACISFFKITL